MLMGKNQSREKDVEDTGENENDQWKEICKEARSQNPRTRGGIDYKQGKAAYFTVPGGEVESPGSDAIRFVGLVVGGKEFEAVTITSNSVCRQELSYGT